MCNNIFYFFHHSSLSELNNKLKGFEPVLDSTGKITGYKTSIGGADTVFPFINIKASEAVILYASGSNSSSSGNPSRYNYIFDEDCELCIATVSAYNPHANSTPTNVSITTTAQNIDVQNNIVPLQVYAQGRSTISFAVITNIKKGDIVYFNSPSNIQANSALIKLR